MTTLSTKYNFKTVEKDQYQIWLKANYFASGNPEKKPFCIVIPPPNVTGKLHLGHAWDGTLQDLIIRRKRMMGYDALFLPGMDHAGIATQAKVDERLKKQGISRYDLGREAFLKKAWEWKDEYAGHIAKQWEALGLSVDYSKERFTLDDDLNKAVNHVFITLYNKGLIYRGKRIINWDVQAKTALSNIEVDHVETHGKLYYFRYPFVKNKGYLVIATTRPETMFADQALMVHPDDPRYQGYIGHKVYIPGTQISIPVIADGYVDQEFGTGVVKVTPAHDANDFEVGKRHNLEMPLCMEEDGKMNQMAFQYEGLDRFDCRKALIEDLEKTGLVEKIEDYTNAIGYSERTGVVVEPRLSLQWFVKMEPLAKKALGTKVNFVPQRFKKTFTNWMNGVEDWCISRQLWWGHRIPVWYKEEQIQVSIKSPGDGWTQDEDVLDTWFSSALWPFSTLGWPKETDDFKRYYPTDVLVTGYDIIFFWVARMIFQGLEFTDKDPFKDVLIHGLIRDARGRKMSKSLDNGVDPMDVISQYGVDALRYFLATNSAPGADMRFEEEKVESSWNFINKLWNITRFIALNIENKNEAIHEKQLSLMDHWILSRLSQTIMEADYNFEKYEFGEASRALYNFIWDDFASWYVEFAKISLANPKQKKTTQAVLIHVLKAVLKLMHPFIPFVTEKLFLEISDEPSIMISDWPVAGKIDFEALEQFKEIQDVITKVRNLRSEHQVAPSKPLAIHLVVEEVAYLKTFKVMDAYFSKFLSCSQLSIEDKLSATAETILLTGAKANIYVIKSDLIDQEKEKMTLLKQKQDLELEIARSESLLKNPNFIAKAPAAKKETEEMKYASYQKQYQMVLSKLKNYV